MKRSAYVRLVLLGSAITVAGCGSVTEELRQQAYGSADDCRRDWQDPKDCTPAPSSGSGAHVGGYYGPRYFWDGESGRPVAVDPDGTTRAVANSHVTHSGSATGTSRVVGSFTRGGFGALGHALGHGFGHGG